MNGTGTQVGGDAESFPGNGQRLSREEAKCHELLVGGPVSWGVQNLNRSQSRCDLAICGRESAHRWEEGWTHGWRQGILSGSVPPKYASGTCGARLPPSSSIHSQQTCWRVASQPWCRGAWGSPCSLPGCFCLCPVEGSWRSQPAAYGSKTRARANPLLST